MQRNDMKDLKQRIEEALDLLRVYFFDYPLDIKPAIQLIKELAGRDLRQIDVNLSYSAGWQDCLEELAKGEDA